ncbi:MAG TPA: methyltransferase domain-containing protein [Gemmatimonadaceae bacterium]|nr:methyltransferase domain-containing protein [Gemmatimonadaceae bacterium]
MKDELRSRLERQFDTVEEVFTIAGRDFLLLRPRNADDLITEEDYVKDERLPYWADIWPSSMMLAERLLEEKGAGRSLIELGCGSGLCACAAAIAGFDVTATDYYDDALAFTQVNARVNAKRAVNTRHVDWSAMPEDVGTFDVVIAADVMYEPRYPPMVSAAIYRLLAPGGHALIADPGRIAFPDFLKECAERGLKVAHEDVREFRSGEIRQTITIYRFDRG